MFIMNTSPKPRKHVQDVVASVAYADNKCPGKFTMAHNGVDVN